MVVMTQMRRVLLTVGLALCLFVQPGTAWRTGLVRTVARSRVGSRRLGIPTYELAIGPEDTMTAVEVQARRNPITGDPFYARQAQVTLDPGVRFIARRGNEEVSNILGPFNDVIEIRDGFNTIQLVNSGALHSERVC